MESGYGKGYFETCNRQAQEVFLTFRTAFEESGWKGGVNPRFLELTERYLQEAAEALNVPAED